MKINIKGVTWTVKVLHNKSFKKAVRKEDADDCYGITYDDTKTIVVDKDTGKARHYLMHELMHAYMYSCCTGTLSEDLTGIQVEEVACEVVALHAKEMLLIADTVLEQFNIKG